MRKIVKHFWVLTLIPLIAVMAFVLPMRVLVVLAIVGIGALACRKLGILMVAMLTLSGNAQEYGFGNLPLLSGGTSTGFGVCDPGNYAVSSGNLIVQVIPSCAACVTNTADLSDLTNVFDLTTHHNDLIGYSLNDGHGVAGFSRPPTFSKTKGPTANPVIWFKNPPAGNAPAILFSLNTNLLPAQPSTIFMALSVSNIAGASGPGPGTWLDSYYYVSGLQAGGRELAQFAGSSGSAGTWYAGSIVSLSAWANSNWVVHTIVFDGANSVWRTNGVLYKAANPGSQGITRLEIGSDVTGVSQGIGLLGALLVYTGHMATNDMQTIEGKIRSTVGF